MRYVGVEVVGVDGRAIGEVYVVIAGPGTWIVQRSSEYAWLRFFGAMVMGGEIVDRRRR